MSIFRAAFKLVLRRPFELVGWVGGISLVGLFLFFAINSSDPAVEIEPVKPTVAVVDRDQSVLSEGLANYLLGRGTPVHIGGSERDLREAAAGGQIAYIAVIPAGYGDSVTGGGPAGGGGQALIETVVTLESAQSRYMDQLAQTFLRLVRAELAARSPWPAGPSACWRGPSPPPLAWSQ
jgi:ABC-2 type transport system permease protein